MENEQLPLIHMALPTALVVEDDDMVRGVLFRMLQRLSFRVIEAKDGNAALEVLKSRRTIDLVLTDLVMPGAINGNTLAVMARELRPTVRVLLITGYGEDSRYVTAALETDEVLLSKPINCAELGDAIADAFAIPESDEAARYEQLLRQRSHYGVRRPRVCAWTPIKQELA